MTDTRILPAPMLFVQAVQCPTWLERGASMNFPFYQSHEGIVGMSDSRRKRECLQVPEDLTGRAVLDIGCNEGLITNWLAQRNAAKVIGIDFDKRRIEYARLTYPAPNISFLCQSWNPLPEGRFDLVPWTSAMHYEKDPKSVLQNIWRQLKPDGLLISGVWLRRDLGPRDGPRHATQRHQALSDAGVSGPGPVGEFCRSGGNGGGSHAG